MSDITELKRLVKALQQASSETVRFPFPCSPSPSIFVYPIPSVDNPFGQEIVDVLQVLKKEAKITESVLRVRQKCRVIPSPEPRRRRPCFFVSCFYLSSSPQESKAGLAVGKLRSHASKDVSELAKEIVRAWKTAVDKEKQAAGTASSKGAATKPAGASPFFFEPSGLTLNQQSSSTTQSVFRLVRATRSCGRLEQWRSYGEERWREHLHHGRQNARQVHRNALRCPRARIGLPCVVSSITLTLRLEDTDKWPLLTQRPTSYCSARAR